MTGQYIVQALFAIAGLVALLASLCNWNWFFTSHSAKSLVRGVNRKKARLFYAALGIILIGMAIYFYIATRKAFGV